MEKNVVEDFLFRPKLQDLPKMRRIRKRRNKCESASSTEVSEGLDVDSHVLLAGTSCRGTSCLCPSDEIGVGLYK